MIERKQLVRSLILVVGLWGGLITASGEAASGEAASEEAASEEAASEENVFIVDPATARTTNENVKVWIDEDLIIVKIIEEHGLRVASVCLNIWDEDGKWCFGGQLARVSANWDARKDYYLFRIHPRLQKTTVLNVEAEKSPEKDLIINFREGGGRIQTVKE